jgi:hypothetical protein
MLVQYGGCCGTLHSGSFKIPFCIVSFNVANISGVRFIIITGFFCHGTVTCIPGSMGVRSTVVDDAASAAAVGSNESTSGTATIPATTAPTADVAAAKNRRRVIFLWPCSESVTIVISITSLVL